MATAEIEYIGSKISIQCDESESMRNILKKFTEKISSDVNSLVFLYSGKIIDQNLKFREIANHQDIERKTMSIVAYELEEQIINIDFNIISRQPICPECGEKIKIKIFDYKIQLYPCKNGHNAKIVLLNEFLKTQKMYFINKLKCDICNSINNCKNKFYTCCNCKNNLCLTCKENHENAHYIIDYENKNYICNEHKEKYISYCKKCDTNICPQCIGEHNNHDYAAFDKMMPNISDYKDKLIELKNIVNEFNNEIKQIIDKLNRVKQNIEICYNIYDNLINSYDNNNINFEIIYNIRENNFYNNIINDLNIINNENDLNKKFENIMIINDKMERHCLFKYLINLRANDTEFQNTFRNYWGNGGHWNSSFRVNNYDQEWEKGYPLLIESHEKLIKLIEKALNNNVKNKYKSEFEKLPENISLPVGTHYIFFNTHNEYVVRNGTIQFLNDINSYQLGYYKKLYNYALKLITTNFMEFDYDKEIKEIEEFEKKMPKTIKNLFHDGKGGNISLQFPLIFDKPGYYVRREKVNDSDTKVKDLLPYGGGVLLVHD